MPDVSFPSLGGIDVEDSTEGSHVSSLDATETSIGLDVDEMDPLMSHDEDVGSPFDGR